MKKCILIFLLFILAVSPAAFTQGKLSGYMFGDYYYNVMRDSSFYHSALSNSASGSSAPGPEARQAFQFRRIYLTYDHDISEKFTTRFRLEADQSTQSSNGKIAVFVKDALLKWKNIFSGSDLIFGIQQTPAFDVSEAAWGFRSLEKTIMDLRGIVDARDMGISLKGKITSDGVFNYWIMIGNGAGTSKPEEDQYKRYYSHIQWKPSSNFQATLYVDYKDGAKNAAGENGTVTTAAFIGYTEPAVFNFGIEAFLASQAHAFHASNGSVDAKQGMGLALFGSYDILPELSAVARYDYFDPNTGSDINSKGDARTLFLAGLSWKVDKNVSLMPNLLAETYETPAGRGEPDPSLTARVTFYYIFL